MQYLGNRRYIEERKEFAPWLDDAQVEQDLVIEKALLELFSDPYLQERLAFDGKEANCFEPVIELTLKGVANFEKKKG